MRRFSLAAAALVAALSTVVAAPAHAHTEVQRATPGPGAVVDGAVDRVELRFLDPVLPSVVIEVRTADGAGVASPGPVTHSDDGLVASIGVDSLSEPGDYVVEYEFVAVDGDAQADAYRFRIAAAAGDSVGPGVVVAGVAAAGLLGFLALSLRRRRGATRPPGAFEPHDT